MYADVVNKFYPECLLTIGCSFSYSARWFQKIDGGFIYGSLSSLRAMHEACGNDYRMDRKLYGWFMDMRGIRYLYRGRNYREWELSKIAVYSSRSSSTGGAPCP